MNGELHKGWLEGEANVFQPYSILSQEIDLVSLGEKLKAEVLG